MVHTSSSEFRVCTIGGLDGRVKKGMRGHIVAKCMFVDVLFMFCSCDQLALMNESTVQPIVEAATMPCDCSSNSSRVRVVYKAKKGYEEGGGAGL